MRGLISLLVAGSFLSTVTAYLGEEYTTIYPGPRNVSLPQAAGKTIILYNIYTDNECGTPYEKLNFFFATGSTGNVYSNSQFINAGVLMTVSTTPLQNSVMPLDTGIRFAFVPGYPDRVKGGVAVQEGTGGATLILKIWDGAGSIAFDKEFAFEGPGLVPECIGSDTSSLYIKMASTLTITGLYNDSACTGTGLLSRPVDVMYDINAACTYVAPNRYIRSEPNSNFALYSDIECSTLITAFENTNSMYAAPDGACKASGSWGIKFGNNGWRPPAAAPPSDSPPAAPRVVTTTVALTGFPASAILNNPSSNKPKLNPTTLASLQDSILAAVQRVCPACTVTLGKVINTVTGDELYNLPNFRMLQAADVKITATFKTTGTEAAAATSGSAFEEELGKSLVAAGFTGAKATIVPPASSTPQVNLALALGVGLGVGGAVLIGAIVAAFCCCKNNKQNKIASSGPDVVVIKAQA